MLSSVLKSERAVLVNIAIMRTFVRMREMIINYSELAAAIADLQRKDQDHDASFAAVFEALDQLARAPEKSRRIGFPE